MTTTRQRRNQSVYRFVRGDCWWCSGVLVFRVHTNQFCGLCDHPISLLPTSTCGAIWGAFVTPNHVTCGTSCGMSLKRLGHQYASSLTSFSGQRILGGTGSSAVLTVVAVMLNCFNICKPLVAGQMPFCSQPVNSLSTTALSVYFSFLVLPVAIFRQRSGYRLCLTLSV
jgi:hypothetical protein